MNQRIRDYLISYCETNGFQTSDEGLEFLLTVETPIYEQIVESKSKWGDYETIFKVVEISGLLIGFNERYNPYTQPKIDLESVCEVACEEKTIIVYKPKEEVENIAVVCKNTEDFISYIRRLTNSQVLGGVLGKFVRKFEHKGIFYHKISSLDDTNGLTFVNWQNTEYVQENKTEFQNLNDYLYCHCVKSK